jgi:hypothetical protein
LYYGGSDGYHFGWRNGFFCLATLRPDGFAGYAQEKSSKPATITTIPVANRKGALRLSADVESGGFVKVKLVDRDSNVLAESKVLKRSSSDKKIKWRDGFSLEKLRSKSAQIQFEFENATIYSFSFAE